ncbi:MAG: hypothetical protein H7345_17685 [Rubritepida sp.]|nr:hypothetical protein [Rubritepida sp.]
MPILLLALLLTACAPPSADQAERDQRPRGPTVSIGGGLGTYVGAGSR